MSISAPVTVNRNEIIVGGSAGPGTLDVQENGVDVLTAGTLNFIGTGVDVADAGSGVAEIDISGGSGGSASSYADYDELRAATSGEAICFVAGMLGGVYYHDATDVTSIDNGGNIIVRADGARYKRQDFSPVNVKWFGATGDGVTDDTSAVLAAVATGFSVIFPNGQYNMSSSIHITTSGQRLIGENTNYSDIVFTTDNTGVIIDEVDSSIWPTPPLATGGSQMVGGLFNLRLRNTSVSPTSNCIEVAPNTQVPSNWNVESFDLNNCWIEGWAIGANIQYSSKFKITNTFFKNCSVKGVYTHGTSNCPKWEQVHVNNCPIGIHLSSTYGMELNLGDFLLTSTAGILIEDSQVDITGGKLEQYEPGPCFDITNSRVTLNGCNFAAPYATPIRLNHQANAITSNCAWSPTDLSNPAYIPALVVHTTNNSTCFGNNGGVYNVADIGNTTYNLSNTQRFSNGQLAQISSIHHVNAKNTLSDPSLTPNDHWLGMLMQEFPVAGVSSGRGGTLVSWGENGDGVKFKYDLANLNLKGTTYDSATKTLEGWEGFVIKDGGTLTLRDPDNDYTNACLAIPKAIFVYNSGAGLLTLNRSLISSASTTINGVASNSTIPAKSGAWLFTSGEDDNWIVTLAGSGSGGAPTYVSFPIDSGSPGSYGDQAASGNEFAWHNGTQWLFTLGYVK